MQPSPFEACNDAALTSVVGGFLGFGSAKTPIEGPPPVNFAPGMNTETLSSKLGGGARSLTDYGYCIATVRKSCEDINPGWIWGVHTKAAGACALKNFPIVCGTPSADSSR